MTTDYKAQAQSAAQSAGIDPNVFVNQIQQESGFNPKAKSSAGAEGIAQFMPGTAAGLGIDPWNPSAALTAAAQYDARNLKLYSGDYQKMLAAYNAGGGTVNSAITKGGSNWLSLMPSQTQNYVKVILAGTNPGTTSSGSPILDTVKQWGEYIAIFVIASVLVIVGFFLLAGKSIVQAVKDTPGNVKKVVA